MHRRKKRKTNLMITGEQTGITPVFEVCLPQHALPRHLLLPLHSSESLSQEDQDYLRMKGVYTLPRHDSCECLLIAYLHHVHPIMPVVDISVLINHHQEGRLDKYNLLLLWSIFFAGVNVSHLISPPSFGISLTMYPSLSHHESGNKKATNLEKR